MTVCVCVPVCVGQQGDDGVAETFTERTEELPVLHVVAGVDAQALLPPLLLGLHRLKVPERVLISTH